MKYVGLDIETYPTLFIIVATEDNGKQHIFKSESWVSVKTVRKFLRWIKTFDWVVTFNGTAFDLRVLTWIANSKKEWVKVSKIASEAQKLIEDQKSEEFVATSECWKIKRSLMDEVRENHFDVFRCYTIDKTKSLKHWELYNGWSVKESDVDFKSKDRLTREQVEDCVLYCCHDVDATLKLFQQKACQELLEARSVLISECEVKVLPDVRPPDLAEFYCYGDTLVDEDCESAYDLIPWEEFSNLPSELIEQMKMMSRNGIYGFAYEPSSQSLQVFNTKKEAKKFSKKGYIKFGKGGAHYVKVGRNDFVYIFDVASMYPHLVWWYTHLKTDSATKRYVGVLLKRLELKKLKGTPQYSKAKDLGYKLVLNSLSGKFRQQGAVGYAPCCGLAMCIIGQLIIFEAASHAVNGDWGNLVEINTDSFAVVGDENVKRAREYCSQVQHHMTFEEDYFPKSYWKDVNNYVVFNEDGTIKETHGEDSSDIVKKGNEPVVGKSLFDNVMLEENGKPFLKKAEFYKDYVVKYSRPTSSKNATIDGIPMDKKHYYFLWVTEDCPNSYNIEFASERIDKANGLIKTRRGVYAFDGEELAQYFPHIDRMQYVEDLKQLLVVWGRKDLCMEFAEKLQRSKVVARNKALKECKSFREVFETMTDFYSKLEYRLL